MRFNVGGGHADGGGTDLCQECAADSGREGRLSKGLMSGRRRSQLSKVCTKIMATDGLFLACGAYEPTSDKNSRNRVCTCFELDTLWRVAGKAGLLLESAILGPG